MTDTSIKSTWRTHGRYLECASLPGLADSDGRTKLSQYKSFTERLESAIIGLTGDG